MEAWVLGAGLAMILIGVFVWQIRCEIRECVTEAVDREAIRLDHRLDELVDRSRRDRIEAEHAAATEQRLSARAEPERMLGNMTQAERIATRLFDLLAAEGEAADHCGSALCGWVGAETCTCNCKRCTRRRTLRAQAQREIEAS